MTTEDKIKEAFEAWWNKSGSSMIPDMMEYGLATTIKDAFFLAHQAGYMACLNGLATTIKDAFFLAHQAGYMACLNGLEQQLKDAERYRWLCGTLESAKGSGSIDVNRELAYYETPEQGKQVRIQWYPDTPIGFYVFEAETINDAIDNAMKE